VYVASEVAVSGEYRNGDPDLFAPDEMRDGIIRKLEAAPADHRYKGALDVLKDINFYTRNFHHAPIAGSVAGRRAEDLLPARPRADPPIWGSVTLAPLC
jgi:hypothetical protein